MDLGSIFSGTFQFCLSVRVSFSKFANFTKGGRNGIRNLYTGAEKVINPAIQDCKKWGILAGRFRVKFHALLNAKCIMSTFQFTFSVVTFLIGWLALNWHPLRYFQDHRQLLNCTDWVRYKKGKTILSKYCLSFPNFQVFLHPGVYIVPKNPIYA